MREYRTIKALRRGEIVDLGGIKFKIDVDESGEEKEIQPGDLYVAERNTGPHLLTARKVNLESGCIFSTCGAYPFDLPECVKVQEA